MSAEQIRVDQMGSLEQIVGRIELQDVDAIVNSAHPSLLHGSGVCGAIHRAAGPRLERYCRSISGCAVGSLVSTPAFDLKAKFVIHAVTPKVLPGNSPTPEDLTSLHNLCRSIFIEAMELGAKSVAVPALAMGGHGFSLDIGMPILARSCAAAARMFDLDVIFVSIDESHHAVFEREAGWSPA